MRGVDIMSGWQGRRTADYVEGADLYDTAADARASIVEQNDDDGDGYHHDSGLPVAKLRDVLAEHKSDAATTDKADDS